MHQFGFIGAETDRLPKKEDREDETRMFPYRAVIVDFDRTLLRTDKSISDDTVRILQECRQAGARLFAATARPERAISEYCEAVAFDAVTTLNGARTIIRDDVYETAINSRSAAYVLRQLNGIGGAVISAETGNGIYANTEIPLWKPTMTDDICSLAEREIIYKILVSHPEIPTDRIRIELTEDLYMTVADQKLIQVMSKDATKWNGIRMMLDAFQIGADQTVYFGDDNDDIEPITKCGCGVAVANALPSVLAIADYVTGSNDEDGVAAFLSELSNRCSGEDRIRD